MYNNENGLTLVEILLSIALLGIVITVFLSFFSDYMLFTKRVEDEVDGINLAEEASFYILSAPQTIDAIGEPVSCSTSDSKEVAVEYLAEEFPDTFYTDDSNQVYYTTPENKNYYIQMKELCQEEREYGLIPIQVEVYRKLQDDTMSLVTATYRYVQMSEEPS